MMMAAMFQRLEAELLAAKEQAAAATQQLKELKGSFKLEQLASASHERVLALNKDLYQ